MHNPVPAPRRMAPSARSLTALLSVPPPPLLQRCWLLAAKHGYELPQPPQPRYCLDTPGSTCCAWCGCTPSRHCCRGLTLENVSMAVQHLTPPDSLPCLIRRLPTPADIPLPAPDACVEAALGAGGWRCLEVVGTEEDQVCSMCTEQPARKGGRRQRCAHTVHGGTLCGAAPLRPCANTSCGLAPCAGADAGGGDGEGGDRGPAHAVRRQRDHRYRANRDGFRR